LSIKLKLTKVTRYFIRKELLVLQKMIKETYEKYLSGTNYLLLNYKKTAETVENHVTGMRVKTNFET